MAAARAAAQEEVKKTEAKPEEAAAHAAELKAHDKEVKEAGEALAKAEKALAAVEGSGVFAIFFKVDENTGEIKIRLFKEDRVPMFIKQAMINPDADVKVEGINISEKMIYIKKFELSRLGPFILDMYDEVEAMIGQKLNN